MNRKLPYELDYKTLKKLRSYETVLLYANIGTIVKRLEFHNELIANVI